MWDELCSFDIECDCKSDNNYNNQKNYIASIRAWVHVIKNQDTCAFHVQ